MDKREFCDICDTLSVRQEVSWFFNLFLLLGQRIFHGFSMD